MRVVLLGVGGAGGAVVDAVAGRRGDDLHVVALDTSRSDLDALDAVPDDRRVAIGSGDDPDGSGGDPDVAATKLKDDEDSFRRALGSVPVADADAVFVVAPLGGATGGGCGPPIAQSLADRIDVPVFGVALLPPEDDEAATETAARTLRPFARATDGLVAFDAAAFPGVSREERVEILAERLDPLIAPGEDLPAADVVEALRSGVSTLGYAAESAPDSDGDVTSLVQQSTLSDLSVLSDCSSADRVLVVASGPTDGVPRSALDAGRGWVGTHARVPTEEVRTGIVAGPEDRLAVLTVFAGVTDAPRIDRLGRQSPVDDGDSGPAATPSAAAAPAEDPVSAGDTSGDLEAPVEGTDDPGDPADATGDPGGGTDPGGTPDATPDPPDDSEPASASGEDPGGTPAPVADATPSPESPADGTSADGSSTDEAEPSERETRPADAAVAHPVEDETTQATEDDPARPIEDESTPGPDDDATPATGDDPRTDEAVGGTDEATPGPDDEEETRASGDDPVPTPGDGPPPTLLVEDDATSGGRPHEGVEVDVAAIEGPLTASAAEDLATTLADLGGQAVLVGGDVSDRAARTLAATGITAVSVAAEGFDRVATAVGATPEVDPQLLSSDDLGTVGGIETGSPDGGVVVESSAGEIRADRSEEIEVDPVTEPSSPAPGSGTGDASDGSSSPGEESAPRDPSGDPGRTIAAESGGEPPTTTPTPPSVDFSEVQMGEYVGETDRAAVREARTPLGERFAVKFPRFGDDVDRETVQRAFRAVDAWQGVSDHDNVAAVLDWGLEPRPWVAIEFLDGDCSGLAGPLPPDEAAWIASQVASAFEYAHQEGALHLALHPGNVGLRSTPSGTFDVPRVTDWGLSRVLVEESSSFGGFPTEYAAPEQLDDDFGDVGPRTDVYQLGVVCYELFVGSPPFEGLSTGVMGKVLSESPEPPSERVSEVPTAVDEVLAPALAKEKADRYDDAAQFRDALEDLSPYR